MMRGSRQAAPSHAPAQQHLPRASEMPGPRLPQQPRAVLAQGRRQPLQPRRSAGRAPHRRDGLNGVGGSVGEELAAGAGVAHGAQRARERRSSRGVVVLVGADGVDNVADLRALAFVSSTSDNDVAIDIWIGYFDLKAQAGKPRMCSVPPQLGRPRRPEQASTSARGGTAGVVRFLT